MIGNKRVVAITLARGGSKSIPYKNITPIMGKPLLQYTSDEVLKSQYIDEYFISTDCNNVSNICDNLGLHVIRRPSSMASDTSKSSDSLLHAINNNNIECDYIIEVMCTNPFKTVNDIDGCIEELHLSGAMSVVSVVRLFDHHPARIKYIEDGFLRDFYPEIPESRRQDLMPPAYIRNGSIYAMRRDFLVKNKIRYSKSTRAYIMPSERTVNIDDPLDLIVAKSVLQRREL